MGYVSGLSLKNVIEITKKNSAPKKLKASLIKDMLQAPPADKQDISQKSITLKRGVKFWEMSYYKFVATIGAEIGDALSYAHRNGIIHGDIKPSNILLTNEAIPMVVDFGLSRNIKDMASAKSSEFSGTLAYAAPEQIKDNTSNEKTDIWSLGVTLYELLTLKNPFANKSIKKTADNILRGNPVPLRTYSKKIPAELEAIVLKCLEGDPANRYATIADLSSDLVNYIELRPIKAKRYGIVKRLQKAVKRKPALAFLYVFLIVLLPLIFVLMANNVLSNMVGSSHPAHRGGSVAQAIETEKMLIKILTFYPFARGYLADNYNNLGYYYMIHDTRHSSDYEKASEYYKKCLSLYPKGTKKKSLREADIYYQSYAALALIYASTGSYAESTEMFKACYRANPTFQPLPQWIAYLLYKQGVKNCSDQNIVEHFKKLGLSDPVDRKIMLAICTELELSRAREKEVELMNQSLRDRGIAD
jgi:tetratricopeptide (TPR) repeat protein